MNWTEDFIKRPPNGTLTRWTAYAPIIGQIQICFHEGCCKDAPQKRYLLECPNLDVKALPLKAKSPKTAQKEAIKALRTRLLEAQEGLLAQ